MERQSRPSFSEPKAKREEMYKRYEEVVVKRTTLAQEQLKKIKQQLVDKKSDQLTDVFVTF
jgi:hypothetical protein